MSKEQKRTAEIARSFIEYSSTVTGSVSFKATPAKPKETNKP